jgi:hypothetical protein
MGDGAAEPPAPEAGGQPELTPELQAEAQKIAEALAKLPSDADGFEQIRGDRGTISRFREFAQTVIQDILPRLQVDKDGLKVFKDVISANCTITLSSRIDSSVELFFNPKTGIIHFLVADFDSSGVEKSIYYGYWDGENDHNHDLLHQPSEAAPGPTTGSGDGLLPPFEDVEGESATTPDKGKEGEHRIVWSPLIDERPLDGSVKQLKSEADKAVSGDEEAIKWLVDRTDTRDSANLVRRLCKEDQVDQLRKYAKLPFRISFLPHYAQAALRLMDENATIEERLFATFLSLGLDPRSLMEATGGREELPGWEYWSTQSAFAYSPKKVLERMVGASGVVGTFYLLNRPLILPLLADVIRDEKFSTEEKVSALTIITSGQTQEPEEACINGLSQELYTILDSSQDQRLKLRAAVALTLSDEPEEKVITTIRQANLNRDMLGYYSEILNSPAGDQEVFERRVRIIDAIAGEYRTMREGFLAEENAEQLEIDSNPKLKAVAIPVFEALNNMPEADDGFEQIRENTEIKSMLENVGRVVCDDLFPDPLPERNKGLRYTDPSGGVLFIRPVSYRNLVEVRFRLSRPGASHQVHANIESGTGRPLSLEYRYSSNDKVSIRDLLSLPTEGEEAPAAPQEGDSAQTSPAVPPEPPVEAAGEAAETTAGQSTETGDGSVRGAETQKEHLAVKDTGGEDVELKPGTKFEMVGDESDSVYEIAKAVQTDDGDWAITFMDDEGKQDEPDIRPATEWQEIFAEMFKRRGNV